MKTPEKSMLVTSSSPLFQSENNNNNILNKYNKYNIQELYYCTNTECLENGGYGYRPPITTVETSFQISLVNKSKYNLDAVIRHTCGRKVIFRLTSKQQSTTLRITNYPGGTLLIDFFYSKSMDHDETGMVQRDRNYGDREVGYDTKGYPMKEYERPFIHIVPLMVLTPTYSFEFIPSSYKDLLVDPPKNLLVGVEKAIEFADDYFVYHRIQVESHQIRVP